MIDADGLIALARELDATHCPGVLGDDNQNGWSGLVPSWHFRLSMSGGTYKADVVKLIGRHAEDFSVVVSPVEKREHVLPAFDRSAEVYCKHMGSQIEDCLFRIGYRDAAKEVWLLADWLETGLLGGFLASNSPERQALAHYIDPAYRVFFVMHGDVFRVDRSGPELVLVPLQTVQGV